MKQIFVLTEFGSSWCLSIDNQKAFATREQAIEELKKGYNELVKTYELHLDVGYVFEFKECRSDEYTINIELEGRLIRYRGEIITLTVEN